jgi:hypothetical protein
MSRRFEADTNALQTTGWSGPSDADDFPVRMKPLLGLAVLRFVAPIISILYVASIVLGFSSCPHYACRGTEIDAFLPAFGLSPFGIPALAIWLYATIKQIRRNEARGAGLLLLAILLSTVLTAITGFIIYLCSP